MNTQMLLWEPSIVGSAAANLTVTAEAAAAAEPTVAPDGNVGGKPSLFAQILDAIGRAYQLPPGCETAYFRI